MNTTTDRPIAAIVKIPVIDHAKYGLSEFHVMQFDHVPNENFVIDRMKEMLFRPYQIPNITALQALALSHSFATALQNWVSGKKLKIEVISVPKTIKLTIPIPDGKEIGLPNEMEVLILTDKEETGGYIVAQLKDIKDNIRHGRGSWADNKQTTPLQTQRVISAIEAEIVRRTEKLKARTYSGTLSVNGEGLKELIDKATESVPQSKTSDTAAQHTKEITYTQREVADLMVGAFITGSNYGNFTAEDIRKSAVSYYHNHKKRY